jgi:hypothetical protein
MMPVATISHVTCKRRCRWLMAGHDDAWSQCPSAALLDPPAACNHPRYDAHPPRSSPVAPRRRRAGRIDRNALRRICPPNPHSTR